jgi:hypothetical protein
MNYQKIMIGRMNRHSLSKEEISKRTTNPLSKYFSKGLNSLISKLL